jgi:uncharacterized cupredoxin-like copper-binding protein
MSPQPSLRRLCLLSIAIASLGFGACGGDDEESGSDSGSQGSSGSSGSGSGGTGAKVALTATESGGFGFSKKQADAKAGNVTLTLENPSSAKAPHAIAVEGGGVDEHGKTVQPGGTSEISANLKAGKYTFYCPVGQHRAAGMEGTLTVR